MPPARHPADAGAREALAAGFTHGDPMPGARGFAAGGPLDVMEPGPVLAGFAGDAADEGLGRLSDDELAGLMGAGRRLASRAAGIELAAVAELAARRQAAAAARGDWRQAEHVADEVAVVLRLTCRAADKLLDLATAVRRLPAVSVALAAGRIDLPRAAVYASELAGLGDVPAAAIAAVTIGDAAALTTGELRAVLHRAVLAHDPAAARRRREKAQKQARVECWAEPAGTAGLAGRDLPPADVLAADKRIDAAARQLKNAGAAGSLEQLRAGVFLALLTGQPPCTLLPGHDNSPGRDDGPAGSPAGPGDDVDSGGGGGTRRPRPGTGPFTGPADPGSPGGGLAAGPALGGSVNLTIPLATWLGLPGQGGEAAGHGPLDPATSRDLAARLARNPATTWCLTITSNTGQAAGHGCAGTSPPTTPPGTGPPGTGPPGRTGPPRGHDPPGGDGPPGPPADIMSWLAAIKISWLQAGTCAHSRQTRGYQPAPLLRHLVKTRDRTCAFPGCRRPAKHCDDDHTIPYHHGGRSCECNLARFAAATTAPSKPPAGSWPSPSPATCTGPCPPAGPPPSPPAPTRSKAPRTGTADISPPPLVLASDPVTTAGRSDDRLPAQIETRSVTAQRYRCDIAHAIWVGFLGLVELPAKGER